MRLFRLEVLGVVFPPGSTPDMIRVGWEQAREWTGWGGGRPGSGQGGEDSPFIHVFTT
jgi:hypothetical protein